MTATAPRASVVIRSYNRYEALAELLTLLTAQRTDFAFEIVVVDQTTRATDAARATLAPLRADARVVWLAAPPLGGPRARNLGVRAARGDVVVLIDDDDLPIGHDWLARHLANFDDPNVVAVTGGERLEGGREPPYRDMARARRLVMSLSWLKWQRIYCRVDVKKPVESVRGSNVAIRRSLIARVGLWDECTPVEDELSFCYRLVARQAPDEVVLFDPEARMLRRMDIPGGMDKRRINAWRFARRHFTFFHDVVAHYYPAGFWLRYPAYGALLWWITADWRWDESKARGGKARAVADLAAFSLTLPLVWAWWLGAHVGRRLTRGAPAHAPKLDDAVGLEEVAAALARAR